MHRASEGPFEDRVIFGLLVDRVTLEIFRGGLLWDTVTVDLLLVFVDTVTVLDTLRSILFVDTATIGLLLDKV